MEIPVQGTKNDAKQSAKREWTKPEITPLGVSSTETGGIGYAGEYTVNGCPVNLFSKATNICAS